MNNLPVNYEAARSNGSTLSDVVMTPKTVEEKLRMLGCRKSQGPDGIPAMTLKELSKKLALPLRIIFNKSIESGVLPFQWKPAIVTPVFLRNMQ